MADLPKDFIQLLRDDLREVYLNLPADTRRGVSALIDRVHEPTDPNRLFKYALLLFEARKMGMSNHATDIKQNTWTAEHAALLHNDSGFDPAVALRLHARGTMARQRISASAGGVLKAWDGFMQVVGRSVADLPPHIAQELNPEHMCALRRQLVRLKVVTNPRRAGVALPKQDPLTPSQQTFMWWYFMTPPYPQQWFDMHSLAKAWKLSEAKDEADFKRIVVRICSGVKEVYWPFPDSWQEVFERE